MSLNGAQNGLQPAPLSLTQSTIKFAVGGLEAQAENM